jgi:predicted O-methyltransferase YrrM
VKYDLLNLPRIDDASRTYESVSARKFCHPVYAWLGVRPVVAQHTAAEHEAIRRWAAGRSTLVEIGVAEGVSALAARETMAANGKLYLIDPFHLSRIPAMNFTKRAAHRAVNDCSRGQVIWIERFSSDAVRKWDAPIDFLFIDGDHSAAGVRRDWEEWNRFVTEDGIVLFHDARIFEGGWTDAGYGPVKLVDDLFRRNRTPEWEIAAEVHSLVAVRRTRQSSQRSAGYSGES